MAAIKLISSRFPERLPPQPSEAELRLLYGPAFAGITQSEILTSGGNRDYLVDARVHKILMVAYQVHQGKTRKNGTNLRIVHEFGTAHDTYNYLPLKKWLHQQGLDPKLGAFAAAAHDICENSRSSASKANQNFDADAVRNNMSAVWEQTSSAPQNVEELERAIHYMTDQEDLKGDRRIQAQRDKSFVNGKCIIDPLLQTLRLMDKENHVITDAKEAQRGHMSIESIREANRQAELKSFVLDFPVTTDEIRVKYKRAQAILERLSNPHRETASALFRRKVTPLVARFARAAS